VTAADCTYTATDQTFYDFSKMKKVLPAYWAEGAGKKVEWSLCTRRPQCRGFICSLNETSQWVSLGSNLTFRDLDANPAGGAVAVVEDGEAGCGTRRRSTTVLLLCGAQTPPLIERLTCAHTALHTLPPSHAQRALCRSPLNIHPLLHWRWQRHWELIVPSPIRAASSPSEPSLMHGSTTHRSIHCLCVAPCTRKGAAMAVVCASTLLAEGRPAVVPSRKSQFKMRTLFCRTQVGIKAAMM